MITDARANLLHRAETHHQSALHHLWLWRMAKAESDREKVRAYRTVVILAIASAYRRLARLPRRSAA